MKASITTVLLLAGLAVGAPTRTDLETRQFDIGTDGLSTLASLLSGLGGSSSSSTPDLSSLVSSLASVGSAGSSVVSSGSSIVSELSSGLSKLLSGLASSSGTGSTTGSSPQASSSPAASSDSNPAGSALSAVSDLVGLVGEHLAKRDALGSITENGVTDKDACQPLTFIFARGTSELGNMGSIAGPPVATKLRSLLNNKVVVQGVEYPASIEGNAMLGAAGGPTMASLVKQALSQCPDTKVVVGGYSQGAMVVHNAASSLSEGQISAAVLFGDPFKDQAVGKVAKADVKEYCAAGDPVCLNGANVLAHLSYGDDAAEAAQFLVTASGVSASNSSASA